MITQTTQQRRPEAQRPKPAQPKRKGRAAAPEEAGMTVPADEVALPAGKASRAGLFERIDADRNGSISLAEFEAWQQGRAGRAGRKGAKDAPPATGAPGEKQRGEPAAFGYTTRFPHTVKELAADFGLGVKELMALNGWSDPLLYVPAGTPIAVPDTPEVLAMAQAYGGTITKEPPAPGEAPAQRPPAEGGQAPKGAPSGQAAGGIGIPGDPNRVHMTQFKHEKWNPSPNAPWGSANCGPTSLAMALKAVGLQPAGLPAGADTEAWIDTTRQAMGAMVDEQGRRGDSAYTNLTQIIRGAEVSGATTELVTFDNLDAALAKGLPVVSSGNPAAYNGDWIERKISNSEYNGGHFITIVGKTAGGGYLINDPLSNVGTVEITPQQMRAYMTYYGGSASAVSVAPA